MTISLTTPFLGETSGSCSYSEIFFCPSEAIHTLGISEHLTVTKWQGNPNISHRKNRWRNLNILQNKLVGKSKHLIEQVGKSKHLTVTNSARGNPCARTSHCNKWLPPTEIALIYIEIVPTEKLFSIRSLPNEIIFQLDLYQLQLPPQTIFIRPSSAPPTPLHISNVPQCNGHDGM